jgi:hypothetical protein
MKIMRLSSKNDESQKITITKCKNGDCILCVSNFEEGAWHSDSLILSKKSNIIGDLEILKEILF